MGEGSKVVSRPALLLTNANTRAHAHHRLFKGGADARASADTSDGGPIEAAAAAFCEVWPTETRPTNEKRRDGDLELDVNATTFQNHTALHEAAREGHEEMCKLLLEAGIQADAREGLGDTALHKAAAAGQADVVRLLVEHGLDVEARNDAGETALDAAHKNGNDDVVELIMGGETKDDLR